MKWEKETCVISRAQFVALIKFACGDALRKNTNKIFFDPKGARCVATDGHTLLMFEDMKPEDTRAHGAKPFCVSVGDAKQIAKSASAKVDLYLSATEDGEHVLVVSAGINLQLTAADSFFPAYRKSIPERVDTRYHTEPACFDALYVRRVALVARALRGDCKAPPGVRIQPGKGPLDPIRFDFAVRPQQHTRAVIVIMPMRMP